MKTFVLKKQIVKWKRIKKDAAFKKEEGQDDQLVFLFIWPKCEVCQEVFPSIGHFLRGQMPPGGTNPVFMEKEKII